MTLLAMLAAAAAFTAAPCPGETTLDTNACLAQQLDSANAELQRYVMAARKRLTDGAGTDPSVLADFDKAESAWAAYRKAECDAVYDNWKAGTIRTAMDLSCQIELTSRHTHTVWSHWLTYMDSTPPILPEPVLPSPQ